MSEPHHSGSPSSAPEPPVAADGPVRDRIRDVLQVLALVRDHHPATLLELRRARREAMSTLSQGRGVGYTGIQDACTRRLGLASTQEFDELAYGWLSEDRPDLRRCIEAHVGVHTADADLAAVRAFFGVPDTPARPSPGDPADDTGGVSARIGDILWMLERICERQPSTADELRRERREAVNARAEVKNVDYRTLLEGCQRRLGFTSIDQFDALVLDWLISGSVALSEHLRAHAASRPREIDLDAIDRFFRERTAAGTLAGGSESGVHAGSASRSSIEAAVLVLQEAAGPLHFREITRRALERGLWTTTGQTPAATLNAEITRNIQRLGAASPFRRVGRGILTLNGSQPPPAVHPELTRRETVSPAPPPPPSPMSFADVAEQVLEQVEQRRPMHYREITANALELGLIRAEGQTPEATLYSQIGSEIARHTRRGEPPRFVKHGRGFVSLSCWETSGLAHQIEEHNRSVRERLLARLRTMPPDAFESLVGDLLGKLGFTEVEVTSRSGDGGIDVRGTLVVGDVIKTRMAVQVKRWRPNVQAPTVQQVRGSLGTHEQGLIITTSDFSPGARTEAERPNAVPVALMNGEQLVKLLVENDIGVRRDTHDLIELQPEPTEV